MARPGTFEPQDAALGHESFSRNADADGYEIVIDTRGTLLWDEPDASERVSRDDLAYLGLRAAHLVDRLRQGARRPRPRV